MRLDSLKQYQTEWIKHIDNIINKYNSTEHSITQIKPNEAGNNNSSMGELASSKCSHNT